MYPMGGGAWSTMRSFRGRDQAAARSRLTPGTLRRIAGFARPFRAELIWFLLLTIFAAVIAVVTPLLAGDVVNEITGTGDERRTTIIWLAVIIAGLAILDAVLSLSSRYYSARIGEGLIYHMRSLVFAHVQRMSIAFFTRAQTGALVTRLNNDINGAQQAFTSTLAGVVSNVIGLVLTVGVMLTLSWQVTLLSLVLLPVFIIPARKVGNRLAEMTRESFALNASMNTTMTERFNVAGALLVNLFGRPADEQTYFQARAGRVRDIGVTTAMYSRAFLVALTLVAALAQALTYGVGGVLAVDGHLDAGAVVSLALLLTRLYGPLTALSNVRVDVMSALVSFERVFEVLDLEPAITDKTDAKQLPPGAARVELDDVRFSYPAAQDVSLASLEDVALPEKSASQPVLHGVSFTAEPGQMVALVGPSGAGKTTITQLVPRIYDVTAGAVRVGGTDVRDLRLQSLRDQIGVVSQDAHLFHDSIRANLAYARPDATERQMVDALTAAQIWPLVSSLPEGLDTVVGDRGYRLSGGEKQRLAIARVLLKAPAIVVLDEATAHLDSESEAAVQRALAAALVGRTSIVIAHRLSTIRQADQIVVLERGRVVQRGTHDELLAQGGLYAELYRTQFALS
ncbi:ABC transporter ATP-binding protein [Blastococcus sp. Marseille-P5729]|uniref:ABC transporter ATP-binding protein n=1 Tax=Blastococcus sp. Marseille-P5729 TaxID=2086582 RepID=UPI001F2171FB|nr:ABC transporter ATP-binding protein [Blastococcus sp. Marseille-P5729]